MTETERRFLRTLAIAAIGGISVVPAPLPGSNLAALNAGTMLPAAVIAIKPSATAPYVADRLR